MTTPAVFSDVIGQLERNSVRYIIVSGVAVVLHGYVRPIADLDIVIDRSTNEAQRAMLTLTAIGFVPSIPLPLSVLTVLRMFDGMNREVDVFVRYHIPFAKLLSDSEIMGVNGNMVRVASLEHVIQAKRITGRPHDIQDIEELLSLGNSSTKLENRRAEL